MGLLQLMNGIKTTKEKYEYKLLNLINPNFFNRAMFQLEYSFAVFFDECVAMGGEDENFCVGD